WPLLGSLAFAQAVQTPQALVISVDRANLRDRPTTSGAVVATLPRGEALEVLETTGAWYRVRVTSSGKTGYVSNTVVRAVPASGAPAAAPPPAASLPPAVPSAPAAPAGPPAAVP